jgi:hypothetical protein
MKSVSRFLFARPADSRALSRRACVAAGLAFLTSPAPLHAQDGSHSIRGSIRDAVGQPIEAALVEIGAAGRSANTTADGRFLLDDVAPGTHLLSVTKDGYLPRYVRFALETNQAEGATLDLGAIVLTTLQEGASGLITAVGTITDSETGAPVPSVAVGLNGIVVAMTDDRGRFRGVAGNLTRGGDNRLTTQRIGYAPVDRLFRVPPDVSQVEFDVALDPTSIELPTITVEAAALSARLTDTGFYRRERSTSGHFFTAEDIEQMAAMYVTDILRRVPGATVLSQQDADLTTGGGAGVRFLRSGFMCSGSPTVYVDHVRVPASNLDLVQNPDRLAGVEVYTSGPATPPEYPGGNCGTILLWTKDALGSNEPSPFQLGAHVGASLADGSSPDRVGGQLTIPFRGPLLVYLGFTQRTGGRGSAWQAFLTMQIKPFGTRNPFYGAMGVALNKPQFVMEAHHLVIAGLTLPVDFGPLSPFTEFHVTGPLTGHAQAFGFAGFNIRIDAR